MDQEGSGKGEFGQGVRVVVTMVMMKNGEERGKKIKSHMRIRESKNTFGFATAPH